MAIKVCHVTSVHPPKDARIFHKECKSLAKLYDVYLLAPNVQSEDVDGVHIRGINIPKNRFARLLNLNKVLDQALKIDASVYHFHDPELMWIGLKIQRHGKKVVFDSHEDVPRQILTKEYLPNWTKKPLSKMYEVIEKCLLSKYDALISVTPFIVERLSHINAFTEMITNYPSIDDYITSDGEMVDFSKRSYVCFAGGVSQRYMHENVIASLEYTKSKYLLAGLAYPSYIEKLKKMRMWENVEYKGFVDRDNVYKLYNKSFAGIVLLDYSPNVGYHQGTLGVLKMFEYMIAGIPVIATDFVVWKNIIEENQCGICIDPHDIHAIANAINYYQNNPAIAKEQGERGRRAVQEKYNWLTQEDKLLKMYKRLIGD